MFCKFSDVCDPETGLSMVIIQYCIYSQ